MENWLKNHEQRTIYLVYKQEDSGVAKGIKSFLEGKGFRVREYQSSVAGSPRTNFAQWAQEADHVLLLVSNRWIQTSSYLGAELETLLHFKDKRVDQFVYPIAIDRLNDIVLTKIVGFGYADPLSEENMTRLIDERLSASPQYKDERPRIPTKARELMTDKPFSYRRDDELSTLNWDYSVRHFRHFPVVDADESLIGIVSLRDILRAEYPDPEVLQHLHEKHPNRPKFIPAEKIFVYEVWTENTRATPLVTAHSDDLLTTVLDGLTSRHELGGKRRYVSAIPVVDDDNCLLGIISYMDFLKKYPDLPIGQAIDFAPHYEVRTIRYNQTLQEALREMGDFRDLPVLDDENNVIGMVSNYEVLKNQHRDYPPH